uniref:pyruvate, water dikinase n=1 Tax=viral metagenome TaxID=1070528 RepID=A0A6C0JD45_9ZZZZ
MSKYIKWINNINMKDISFVGGKNASLGEMYINLTNKGIRIPNAFVLTSECFNQFIKHNNLENKIHDLLNSIDINNIVDLRRKGLDIRSEITNGIIPENINNEILNSYKELSNLYFDSQGNKQNNTDVAVRSSSTAEDLPDASFAGLQETYLNVRGKNQLLDSIKNCFASLYTDRAISYRKSMNYTNDVTISVCIQKMVRSDLGKSGVAFSIDSESGFKKSILINASWGLGEMVVGGKIKPDEFIVFKDKLEEFLPIIDKKLGNKTHKMIYGNNPNTLTEIVHVDEDLKDKFCLNDIEIIELSKWVVIIEDYYTALNKKWSPMDIEWAYDGLSNQMFILQARPETVNSNKNLNEIIEYKIDDKINKDKLLEGISVGDKIISGKVKILYSLDERHGNMGPGNFKKGDILVTNITDPDWEPIMKIAGGIITNKGGRVCHAAIVARELGIPTIVGTINATNILKNNDEITISCAEGDIGYVYKGSIPFNLTKTNINEFPKLKTKIMFNIGSPENAFKMSMLPNDGVGLAREEFIINNFIGVHPLALINHKDLKDTKLIEQIDKMILGYDNAQEYFIEKLSYGIARIAAAFYPKNVIVRLSDFKSNEYYNLLGGKYYEPTESNPMIGWRGCSRYYSKDYKLAFGLECKAIYKVRDVMGLTNVTVMLPFCRTPEECKKVLDVMKENYLERDVNDLKIALMCELPVNCLLADEFCKLVDIFSIGSNDLTQTVLAVDRDSELISHIFDERNPAVKKMIKMAIDSCKKNNVKIGICGQGPSDYPDFAQFLVENGIDSISITPDAVLKTHMAIKDVENKIL